MAKESIELFVTNRCNWFCDYCLVDTHNQPDKSFEDVMIDVHSIPAESEVTLSGGEPGLLSRSQLTEILETLKAKNCVIDLLTNGTFIRKYSDMLHYFDTILYHCLEYLTDEEIEYPKLDQTKVKYILVTENENLEDGTLLNVMNKYTHIKFLIFPEARPRRKINMIKLYRFVTEHKDRLYPNTLEEIAYKLRRSWGETGWETIHFNREKKNGSTG
jgi:organic radical activating enzyme